MGFREYKWKVSNVDFELREKLSIELGIKQATAQLLINRGIKNQEEGKKYFFSSLDDLYSPSIMKGLVPAVEKIKQALQENKKITVYGDYDVDGITSTAILVSLFQEMGGEVSYYIPNRFNEGYGLNFQALDKIREKGTDLLITVDCGITSYEEVEYAKKKGMEVIVTDHHTPLDILPQCITVNPVQPDCVYPWEKLAGVGVVFKLVQLLLPKEKLENYLDLVALGTIADVVPLMDENRIIVKYGMKRINSFPCSGIQALKEVSGFGDKKLSSYQVPYSLAPRLNAAGRMGEAELAVELLLTESLPQALDIAKKLVEYNRERQEIESNILKEAVQEIEEKKLHQRKVLVLARDGWHPGVTGIVASRLVEAYYRPVVLICLEGDEGKGSARGIEGFNLFKALHQCSEVLTRYGGHERAAGLTIPRDNIEEFDRQINFLAQKQLPPSIMVPRLYLEAELDPADITLEFLDELKLLDPFGCANPVPLFKGKDLEIEEFNYVGKQKNHLKVKLKSKQHILEGIAFNAENIKAPLAYRKVSAAFILEDNSWGECRRPVLQIKDFYFTDYIHNGGINLIDRRDLAKKETYLRNLAKMGKTLIYINTWSQEEKIFKILGRDSQFFFCHQGSINEDILENIKHLVIFDLPLEASKFFPAIKKFTENNTDINVHLLFGLEDLKVNKMLMQAFLPQRSSLVKVYQAMKKLEKKGKVDTNKLSQYLENYPGFPYTKHLFKRSLDIFREINVVKPLPGEPEKTELLSSRDVRNLDNSRLFMEASCLQKEFEDFQTFLLEADREVLVSLIIDNECDVSLWNGCRVKEGG